MTPYLVVFMLASMARLSYGDRCDMRHCYIPMIPYSGALSELPPDQVPQFCSDAGQALGCMDEVVGECQYMKDTVSSFDVMISRVCGERDLDEDEDENEDDRRRGTTCSFRRKGKIQRCAHKLQRLVYDQPIVCGKVRRTIGCLQKNIAKCPSVFNPAVIRLDTLRSNLLSICVETEAPSTRGPPTTQAPTTQAPTTQAPATCPDDFMTPMQNCLGDLSAQMQVLSSGAPEGMQACSSLTSSLDCVSNLTVACGDNAQFASMASMFNVDQIRTQASFLCAGDDGGDRGCPSNLQQEILDCVAPLQGVGVNDQSAMCSMARTAFSCVDDLVAICGSRLGDLLSQMQFDRTRQALASVCE
ncbi:uncharacterized protein [Haliotis cracherodii]|uniref:uncharacterized protein isoform X2 n=1 Tax=Haliotis cracherodii TaxID=6455 RepID=UPI0039E8C76F